MSIELERRDYCDDDYEDNEETISPDNYCRDCGRPAVGDQCQQCGLPLCPMCSETGAGFCKRHPDEYLDGYPSMEKLDLEAIEEIVSDPRYSREKETPQ